MTKHEARLWQFLKDDALGVSFRKQHPIGPYFADFYCARLKLAIELDGSQHGAQVVYDAERSDFLAPRGILVLRFWNWEIEGEGLDGVVMKISDVIRARKSERGLS